jgi:aryl-alcohol dehydrogenase-like predicted oxidoreductase
VSETVSATLGLGTAVFVPQYGVDQAGLTTNDPQRLLREAVAQGIRYVDTAAGYGSSESVLGKISVELAASDVRICTKLSAHDLATGIDESLARLRAPRVDTLLVHSAGRDVLADPAIADAFENAKDRELVIRCGASTYGADDATFALSQPWCDVVQVEFSVVNTSVVRAIQAARRTDQEIVVRSVLGQGMLTGRRHEARHLGERALSILSRLEGLARDWGMGLEQLAIRFALDTPGVDIALVGIGSNTELETALAAANAPPLTSVQRAALAEFDLSNEDWTHPERWVRA